MDQPPAARRTASGRAQILSGLRNVNKNEISNQTQQDFIVSHRVISLHEHFTYKY